MMKGCEPRDLLNKVTDICVFEGQELQLTPGLIDLAWGNYFGTAHGFGPSVDRFQAAAAGAEPLPMQ